MKKTMRRRLRVERDRAKKWERKRDIQRAQYHSKQTWKTLKSIKLEYVWQFQWHDNLLNVTRYVYVVIEQWNGQMHNTLTYRHRMRFHYGFCLFRKSFNCLVHWYIRSAALEMHLRSIDNMHTSRQLSIVPNMHNLKQSPTHTTHIHIHAFIILYAFCIPFNNCPAFDPN